MMQIRYNPLCDASVRLLQTFLSCQMDKAFVLIADLPYDDRLLVGWREE